MSKDLEKRLAAIEARNNKVEIDKAWETSATRRLLIVGLTYIVLAIFMKFAHIDRPFISAIIPAIGFGLSTLTISYVKDIWINNRD